MTKTVRFAAAFLASTFMLAACGDSAEPAAPCAPSGSWTLTDTRTSSSGGYCATAEMATETTPVLITVNAAAGTFTWTEDGTPFAGTINLGTCSGNVTAGNSVPFVDEVGADALLNASVSRTMTFNGNSVSGTAAFQMSTTGVLTGVPCSLNGSFTGTRQ